SDLNPNAFVASANIHRRHLTPEQRKTIAAAVLKANPERSNRSIAAEVKLDKNTVQDVRQELEASGEIHQSETRISSSGQKRKPSKKTAAKVKSPSHTPAAELPAEKQPASAPSAAKPSKSTPTPKPRPPAPKEGEEMTTEIDKGLHRDIDDTGKAFGKMLGDCEARLPPYPSPAGSSSTLESSKPLLGQQQRRPSTSVI